jgi:hypothetical protein
VRLSERQVVERWSGVFRVPRIVQRWQEGLAGEAETAFALVLIEQWRARLMDVSWFMRCLNEYLARRANAEDQCTGRFWEGRFKSQALLDEAGLLTAMAYVDLNPVRAGLAQTPEGSEFTSIYARIQALKPPCTRTAASSSMPAARLMPFRDQASRDQTSLPIHLADYLQLLDWSGRTVRPGKRGVIAERAPPILERLSIDADVWRQAMQLRGNVFGRALGRLDRMRLHAHALRQSRIKGLGYAKRLFQSA